MSFKIREPLWGLKAVGLAVRDMNSDRIEVEITYKNKAGDRLYPDVMWIPKSVAMSCSDMVRKGVKLKIVPISMLRKD